MDLLRKETIDFLSQIAERKTKQIPLESIHHYTSIVKHVSGAHLLKPISKVNDQLRYIEIKHFEGFPTLKAEIQGLFTLKETIESA